MTSAFEPASAERFRPESQLCELELTRRWTRSGPAPTPSPPSDVIVAGPVPHPGAPLRNCIPRARTRTGGRFASLQLSGPESSRSGQSAPAVPAFCRRSEPVRREPVRRSELRRSNVGGGSTATRGSFPLRPSPCTRRSESWRRSGPACSLASLGAVSASARSSSAVSGWRPITTVEPFTLTIGYVWSENPDGPERS